LTTHKNYDLTQDLEKIAKDISIAAKENAELSKAEKVALKKKRKKQ